MRQIEENSMAPPDDNSSAVDVTLLHTGMLHSFDKLLEWPAVFLDKARGLIPKTSNNANKDLTFIQCV